jgi:hypothetical protein
MNSLKEGAMWHVDPLLGGDREIGDYTAAIARQWPVNNNNVPCQWLRMQQRNSVFCVVHAEML